VDKTIQVIKSWEKDLKIAMFCTGSKNLTELKIAKLLSG
jgi:isopentenyl diphosphate isomerase/L-lactate dehydrogenase-like FMN-dependent dehydrogenase